MAPPFAAAPGRGILRYVKQGNPFEITHDLKTHTKVQIYCIRKNFYFAKSHKYFFDSERSKVKTLVASEASLKFCFSKPVKSSLNVVG